MHTLILGRTGSGKTLLSTQLSHEYYRRGILSLVLDPIGSPHWKAHYVTDDPVEFNRVARLSTCCALWIDESGDVVGQYDRSMFWVVTRARHLGHSSHLIAQRAAQLSPTVRGQCERLVLFAVDREDSRIMAREWGFDELEEAWRLPRLHFYTCSRFGEIEKGIVKLPAAPLVGPAPASEPANPQPVEEPRRDDSPAPGE